MNDYTQRRSSFNNLHAQEYDYPYHRALLPHGPPPIVTVNPEPLPHGSSPLEHVPQRKFSDPSSFANGGGFGAGDVFQSLNSSGMSDLDKLRALKRAIMDGRLPGYDSTPKPQALEALYEPRGNNSADRKDADRYYQRDEPFGNQRARGASQNGEIPAPPHHEPAKDRPIAPPPASNTNKFTPPQANEDVHSPSSMIMSPTERRLPITDMEIDSPPTSAVPRSIHGQINAVSVKPVQGQHDPGNNATVDNTSRFEQRHESTSTAVAQSRQRSNTYSEDSRRQDEARYHDYGPQRREGDYTNPSGPESSPSRGYRRPLSPDSRSGGPPRSSNDGRYDYYGSDSRLSGNVSPRRSSLADRRGYDPRTEDNNRELLREREQYSGRPRERSPDALRNFSNDKAPAQYREPAHQRNPSGHSTLSERELGIPPRKVPEGRTMLPPANPPTAAPTDSSVLPTPRAFDNSTYSSEHGPKYGPDSTQSTVISNLPMNGVQNLPFEANAGAPIIKKEQSEDGDLGRRSATPRSESAAGARQSSFPPIRGAESLPNRPPPAAEEPIASRNPLMPDRIAEPRAHVPLAARLTSPNDYAQRGQKGGPPPNIMRGPPNDARRSVDDSRYAPLAEQDSWGRSGRIDEPLRRDSGYARSDDSRDFARYPPHGDWERSHSPPTDRYGPAMSSRPAPPAMGYPYGRDRSQSPPRRGGAYPRPAYPADYNDGRGNKRHMMDADDRRAPPAWRPREDYGSRAPLPSRPVYADTRGPYTRSPPPPDLYRPYDREPYPADNRRLPPYGADRDRYAPETTDWTGRPPYRR